MIGKKKIEEAAKRHMLIEYNEGDFPVKISEIKEQCESDFKAGANWAIKEFLKNLWKGPEIVPKPNSDIIAISEKNMPYVFCNVEIPNVEIPNWRYLMKSHNIERWCYLDDILPWEGGSDV